MEKPKFEKVVRDGKVAVLVSRGFGAGWSTWVDEELRDAFAFDADLVNAYLGGGPERVKAVAEEKYPDAYLGGVHQLRVEWLPVGSVFFVQEYDGSESLHVVGGSEFMVA